MAPSSRISHLPLFVLFSTSQLIPLITAYTQCYYPDGSIPKDYFWSACKYDSEGHSGCCDYKSGDVCQPNGLCLSIGSTHNSTYRATCTDRTWKDPSCPQICIDGEEDDWVWTTPCSSKGDGSDITYVCGTRAKENNQRIASNCTSTASKYTANFIYTESSITKPTRFVPPPTVDPKLFSVFTETYTARVTALDYNIPTSLTTTWESTFTSAIGGAIVTPPPSGSTSPNTAASQTASSDSTNSSTASTSAAPQSRGASPAVLGGAIGGAAVAIAALLGLLFFLRKKRAAKNGSQRIGSPDLTPANGPVGKDQVVPYEVSGADAAAGAFAPEKKYMYAGENGDAYEMSSAGEKGWGGQGQNQGHPQVAEVASGDQRVGAFEMGSGEQRFAAEVEGTSSTGWNEQHMQTSHNGEVSRSGTVIVSPMTPVPSYGLMPSRNGAVEMDGSDYAPSRPTTATGSVRGRNGVGNA